MANELKITTKIVKKASTGKGVVLEGQEGWFSVPEKLTSFLAKMNTGDAVEVTYVKKGVFKNVIGLYPANSESPKKEETKTATGFNCSDCGAELKDGKYKRCYACNQKPKETKKEEPQKTQIFDESESKTKKEWTPGNYNNPEKTAQIQRGNALNAAGSAISGNLIDKDPETIKEATLILADAFLDWLRAE